MESFAKSNFTNITNITEGDFLLDHITIDFTLLLQKLPT